MLHNSLRAEELYALIWKDEFIPIRLREVAGFEACLLFLLEGRAQEIEDVLAVTRSDDGGPYRTLTEWITGVEKPLEMAAIRVSPQVRLQRYAVLAEAVKEASQENPSRSKELLRDLKEKGKRDPFLWPLPYANYLQGRL